MKLIQRHIKKFEQFISILNTKDPNEENEMKKKNDKKNPEIEQNEMPFDENEEDFKEFAERLNLMVNK